MRAGSGGIIRDGKPLFRPGEKKTCPETRAGCLRPGLRFEEAGLAHQFSSKCWPASRLGTGLPAPPPVSLPPAFAVEEFSQQPLFVRMRWRYVFNGRQRGFLGSDVLLIMLPEFVGDREIRTKKARLLGSDQLADM